MRVLVATDGSPSAGTAVEVVAGIAWPQGSTILVVEAIETGVDLFGGPWPAVTYVQDKSMDTALADAAEDALETTRARLARPGLQVATKILLGRPATVIVEAIEAIGADVVVIGSRGHGTIERMLLGSVSAEVVDHATVPVLVARGASADRVILAWDGSSSARAAAHLLEAWPVFGDARVRVVSVADVGVPWWTGVPVGGSPGPQPIYADAASASHRGHDELARGMADELQQAGIEADAECRDGDPATEILAAARSWGADLIVMGTHGRTGLARLVLGSVARNVLHHATCSVLITRQPGQTGQER